MNQINLTDLEKYALEFKQFNLNEGLVSDINKSFDFLKEFSSDKIIYGINTGFGPMAQFKIDEDKLNQLQYNLIRSHSTGTGNILDEE